MDIFDEIIGGVSLKLISCGCVCHSDTWKESKTKLYQTLWSISEGSLCISMGGEEFRASAGDVVLFSPGDVYTAWSETGCTFVYNFFSFELSHPSNISAYDSLTAIISSPDMSRSCQAFCKGFKPNTHTRKSPGLRAYSTFLLYITEILGFMRLGRCKMLKKRDTGAPSTEMHRAISYMSEHYAEGISVKEIADRFNIGEKHFITKFKAITGMSPKQYLTECRMRRAVELLRDEDQTVAATASALGYSDQYSFSKAFKKHYGESPSSFR